MRGSGRKGMLEDAERVVAREVEDGLPIANYKLTTWLFYRAVNWVEIF